MKDVPDLIISKFCNQSKINGGVLSAPYILLKLIRKVYRHIHKFLSSKTILPYVKNIQAL